MSQRKHISPQQKVIILREHLENQVPLSDLSERYGVHINLLYCWEKELFEGAGDIFSRKQEKESAADTRLAARLTEKLRAKDKLIDELVQDNIALKKVSLATADPLLGGDGRAGQRERLRGEHLCLLAPDFFLSTSPSCSLLSTYYPSVFICGSDMYNTSVSIFFIPAQTFFPFCVHFFPFCVFIGSFNSSPMSNHADHHG